MLRSILALILCAAWAWPLPAAVVLQLRVVDGEGLVYAVKSRATRGLAVLVTDETGKPVEGAIVSFQLPDSGPGGTFANGTHTEIVTTKADGLGSVWGMKWNATPGPFEIRITGSKDQARAGIVSAQYLSEAGAQSAGKFRASHGSHRKLIWVSAVAAGAAAGLIAARSSGPKTAAAAPAAQTLQIGTPSLTISHP